MRGPVVAGIDLAGLDAAANREYAECVGEFEVGLAAASWRAARRHSGSDAAALGKLLVLAAAAGGWYGEAAHTRAWQVYAAGLLWVARLDGTGGGEGGCEPAPADEEGGKAMNDAIRPVRYIRYGAPFAWVDPDGKTRQAVSGGTVTILGEVHYLTGSLPYPYVPFSRVDPLGTPPSSWCLTPGRDYPEHNCHASSDTPGAVAPGL